MEPSTPFQISVEGRNARTLYGASFKCEDFGVNCRYRLTVEGVEQYLLQINDFKKVLINVSNEQHNLTHQGELLHASQKATLSGAVRYCLQFGCSLDRLDNISNQRLFIAQPIKVILQTILSAHRINAVFDLARNNKCSYTAQAGISDYELLVKLCIEEGIIFYYRFEDGQTALHFTDKPIIGGRHSLPFNPANALVESAPVITALEYGRHALPERITLTGASEYEPNRRFEARGRSASDMPGSGEMSINHLRPIKTQDDCDFLAAALQEQLDWQREWLTVEVASYPLQPGDVLRIHSHPAAKMNRAYQVLHVESSTSLSKEKPHPFRLRAFLIPFDQVYKQGEFYPDPFNSFQPRRPTPSLQRAVIKGEKNEVTLDEQGRYAVRPLFSAGEETIESEQYVRSLHPASCVLNDRGHGMHWPLLPNTEVILGHLNNDVNQPIILGVVPGRFQVSPVNDNNRNELTLRHENGSGLTIKDTSETQTMMLATQHAQHGLLFEKDGNKERISAESQGKMMIESHKPMRLQSGLDTHIGGETVEFSAKEALSLSAAAQSTMKAQAITYDVKNDWQAQANTALAMETKRLHLKGMTVGWQSSHLTIHAQQSEVRAHTTLTAMGNEVSLEAGASQVALSGGNVNLQAPQITLSAAQIIKNQGVAALIALASESS